MGWKILDAAGAEKLAASSGVSTPTQTILTASSGTYTPPVGCTEILVECIGGGGGGGGCPSTTTGQLAYSGAGGGGAYAASVIANPAGSYAYAVGQGGNGGAIGANNGIAGGDTSFGGGIVLAKGGAFGNAGASTASTGWVTGGVGGQASSCVGSEVMSGENGTYGFAWAIVNGNVQGGIGGSGARGGSGGYLAGTGGGVNGSAPGGGGSGCARPIAAGTGANGGNGGNGVIIITEFYGTPTASSIPVHAPTTTYLTASSGTYTTPANCAYIVVEAIGGGGAGGPCNAGPASGGGGGGGAYAKKTIQNPSSTYAYAIGQGGTATSYPTAGNAGGDTTFGSTVVVAKGGTGGAAGGTVTPPVPGGGPVAGGSGAASTGDITVDGGNSIVGFSLSTSWVLGGIGGSGAGPYGGKQSVQRESAGALAGVGGELYGGGGGGGTASSGGAAQQGGAGAQGIIVVTEYYQQPQQFIAPSSSPKFSSNDFASGPPANPVNGDIWYATNVDGNGTTWQFRYNANSSSAYKWEFVGGGSFSQLLNLSSQVLSSGVFTNLTGMTFTPARGGDYEIVAGAIGTYGTGIANSTIELCIAVAGTTVSTVATRSLSAPPSAFDWNLPGTPAIITSVAASSVITLQGFNNSTGYTWTQAGWAIRPRRVA